MFAYDYFPGRTLQTVARLQQSVSRQILGQETEDDGQLVSDTSEWDTWLAQYQVDDMGGEYVLVFTRNGQVSDSLQLGTSATFFSDEFNLLEVVVSGDGDGTPTPEDGTPTPEDGTPTPEDGTPTPEEGTPTPEDGGGTPTPGDGGGTPTPEPGGDGGGGGGDAGA